MEAPYSNPPPCEDANGQRSCGSKDITYLTCLFNLTLQHHVIKRFFDFTAIVIAVVETKHLTCHLTLQDHVVKGSFDVMEGSSSLNAATLPDLVGIGIVVVKIMFYHMASRYHLFKGLCNFVGGSFS